MAPVGDFSVLVGSTSALLVKVWYWLVLVGSTSVLVDLIYEPVGFMLAPVGDFSVLVGSTSASVGDSLVLVGSGL